MPIDYSVINIPTKSKMEKFIYPGKLYVVYVVRYLKIILVSNKMKKYIVLDTYCIAQYSLSNHGYYYFNNYKDTKLVPKGIKKPLN